MSAITNVDVVRAEIMRLERAEMFDQRAWALVLMALRDRPCARANAVRRMETAKLNALVVVVNEPTVRVVVDAAIEAM